MNLRRGTLTYDCIAISQVIIQYIIEKLYFKTLFVTHYHELIKLEEKFPKEVKNFSVTVYDNNKQIVSMKNIVPYGASKSYTIHVAEFAGLLSSIIYNSNSILKNLENNKKVIKQDSLF